MVSGIVSGILIFVFCNFVRKSNIKKEILNMPEMLYPGETEKNVL